MEEGRGLGRAGGEGLKISKDIVVLDSVVMGSVVTAELRSYVAVRSIVPLSKLHVISPSLL